MVYLSRIYTRTGDTGETSLGNGTRVPKTHPRIVAFGAVDELNAVLGAALAGGLTEDIAGPLRRVQNDLFDLGADLCVPESDAPSDAPRLRIVAGQWQALERWIDQANERLAPLESFILPGGTPAAAALHVARVVCRRAEIAVLHLAEREPVNPDVIVYLNRLSDLLFVLARRSNDEGRGDVLWVPGANRSRTQPAQPAQNRHEGDTADDADDR